MKSGVKIKDEDDSTDKDADESTSTGTALGQVQAQVQVTYRIVMSSVALSCHDTLSLAWSCQAIKDRSVFMKWHIMACHVTSHPKNVFYSCSSQCPTRANDHTWTTQHHKLRT